MKQITIVGMGPGDKSYLTLEALELLTGGETILLRTEKHPVVSYLAEKGMNYETFDSVYDTAETFDETYEKIATDVLKRAAEAPVIYAVPGNPFVAEKTVQLIMEGCNSELLKIVHGVSFLDAIITALHYDPVKGLEVIDGLQIHEEAINCKKDKLIIQVYNQTVASDVKLHLMEKYRDEHTVKIVRAAGIEGMQTILETPLFELDRYAEHFDHLTSLFVPAMTDGKYSFDDLNRIMATLRSEHGCPWDREQTHESLTRYLVEEAYEVLEAVDRQDDESLVDELGDVLLQVVFHATIANEDGYFSIDDITNAVCEKMVRRHPHVFSDVSVENSDEVLVNWQAIKAEEKNNQYQYQAMTALSQSIPSLIRSQKVQKIASNVGFDWQNVQQAMEKVDEELLELKAEIDKGDLIRAEEELGDLLLILSNVSRHLKIDSEIALAKTIDKFVSRFQYVEQKLEAENLKPSSDLLDKMDKLWGEAKSYHKL